MKIIGKKLKKMSFDFFSTQSYSEAVINNERVSNENETNLEKLLRQAKVIDCQLESLMTSLNYIEQVLKVVENEEEDKNTGN